MNSSYTPVTFAQQSETPEVQCIYESSRRKANRDRQQGKWSPLLASLTVPLRQEFHIKTLSLQANNRKYYDINTDDGEQRYEI